MSASQQILLLYTTCIMPATNSASNCIVAAEAMDGSSIARAFCMALILTMIIVSIVILVHDTWEDF